MKALILMADDGVSANIFLQLARHHLAEGKSVLFISGDSNPYHVIGAGDDLPAVNPELLQHPNFEAMFLSPGDTTELLSKLNALPATTVVMFNCGLFELATQEPGVNAVIEAAGKLVNDVVFSEYRRWFERRTDVSSVPLFNAIDWDYFSGSYSLPVDSIKQLMPGLARMLEQPPRPVKPDPRSVDWFVLNRTGTYWYMAPYHFTRDIEHFRPLWDVVHAHVKPPQLAPAAQPVRRHRFMERLASLVGRGQ